MVPAGEKDVAQDIVLLVCHNNQRKLQHLVASSQISIEQVKALTYSFPPFLCSSTKALRQEFPRAVLRRTSVGLIHIAAYVDSFETFLYLLSLGIPIRQKTADGYLPIHYGCESGSLECVSYIIARDPEVLSIDPSLAIEHVCLATYAGCPRILRMFFDAGIHMKEAKIFSQCVHQAIKSRRIDCLTMLLEREGTPVSVQNGLNPLMKAITAGMNEAIMPLILAGVDPLFENENGDTPLSIACKLRNVEAVRILVGRLFKLEKSELGLSGAIHWACCSVCPEIVEMILKKGCNMYKVDSAGRMGPEYLVDMNPKAVLEILSILAQHGFDFNRRKSGQHSYLYLFSVEAMRPNEAVIRFRLDHGLRPEPEELADLCSHIPSPSIRNMVAEHFHV